MLILCQELVPCSRVAGEGKIGDLYLPSSNIIVQNYHTVLNFILSVIICSKLSDLVYVLRSIEKKTIFIQYKKKRRKITSSSVQNKLTMPWLKKTKTNRQTIMHKTPYRKLKTKQYKPHQKIGVIAKRVSRFCSTCDSMILQ